MPINTRSAAPAPLTPAAREALIAAIEAALNEQDIRFGYEPSQFNAADAAEEVALWEQGDQCTWVDSLPWWELPVSLRPAGWSLLQRPTSHSEESWEGLSFDR